MQLLQAREALDADALIHLDPDELQCLMSGHPKFIFNKGRRGWGLDALRRAGWRGAGPVPYAHEPNRGFLRALYALGRAAAGIGESEEVERIRTFLRDSDPTAAEQIEADQGRARG